MGRKMDWDDVPRDARWAIIEQDLRRQPFVNKQIANLIAKERGASARVVIARAAALGIFRTNVVSSAEARAAFRSGPAIADAIREADKPQSQGPQRPSGKVAFYAICVVAALLVVAFCQPQDDRSAIEKGADRLCEAVGGCR